MAISGLTLSRWLTLAPALTKVLTIMTCPLPTAASNAVSAKSSWIRQYNQQVYEKVQVSVIVLVHVHLNGAHPKAFSRNIGKIIKFLTKWISFEGREPLNISWSRCIVITYCAHYALIIDTYNIIIVLNTVTSVNLSRFTFWHQSIEKSSLYIILLFRMISKTTQAMDFKLAGVAVQRLWLAMTSQVTNVCQHNTIGFLMHMEGHILLIQSN